MHALHTKELLYSLIFVISIESDAVVAVTKIWIGDEDDSFEEIVTEMVYLAPFLALWSKRYEEI